MCNYHTVPAADPARHGTDAGERFRAAMQVQFDAMNVPALRRLLDAAVAYSDPQNDASTTSELLNAAKSLDHLYVDWHPLNPCWGKFDDHQAGKLVSAALLFACARRDDATSGSRVSDKSRKRLDSETMGDCAAARSDRAAKGRCVMTKSIKPETVQQLALELIQQLGTSVTRAEVNRELSYRHGGAAHVNEATFNQLYGSCFAEGCLADDEPTNAKIDDHAPKASVKPRGKYGEKSKQIRELFADLGFCDEKTFDAAAKARGFSVSSPTFYKNRRLLFDENGKSRAAASGESQPKQSPVAKPAVPAKAATVEPPPKWHIPPGPPPPHPITRLAEIVEWAGGIKRLREMLDLIEQIKA